MSVKIINEQCIREVLKRKDLGENDIWLDEGKRRKAKDDSAIQLICIVICLSD